MPQLKRNTSPPPTEEYAVYIYKKPNPRAIGESDWARMATTTNKHRALLKAQKLFASNDFQRVEVKCKITEAQGKQAIGKTLKSYEKRDWLPEIIKHLPSLSGFILGALVAGSAALFVFLYF